MDFHHYAGLTSTSVDELQKKRGVFLHQSKGLFDFAPTYDLKKLGIARVSVDFCGRPCCELAAIQQNYLMLWQVKVLLEGFITLVIIFLSHRTLAFRGSGRLKSGIRRRTWVFGVSGECF